MSDARASDGRKSEGPADDERDRGGQGGRTGDARTEAAREQVQALLAAFRTASDAREPARRLWESASPRFRSRLGGPDHLAHLFGNPAWAPLMGHARAEVTALERIDRSARANVAIVDDDGAEVRYLVSLVQSDGVGDTSGIDADGRRGADDTGADDGSGADDGGAWRISGFVRAELADA